MTANKETMLYLKDPRKRELNNIVTDGTEKEITFSVNTQGSYLKNGEVMLIKNTEKTTMTVFGGKEGILLTK